MVEEGQVIYREIVAGTGSGAGMAVLAWFLFRRTLSGSHEVFLRSFGAVFGLQGLGFLALGALAWAGWSPLPLLGGYGAACVLGTLAVALVLKPVGHAR